MYEHTYICTCLSTVDIARNILHMYIHLGASLNAKKIYENSLFTIQKHDCVFSQIARSLVVSS